MSGESPGFPIPDYQLLSRIGGGSYGEVWLGRSAATGALRAVKIVHRSAFTDDRPYNREFEGLKKFEEISRSHPSQLALFHVGRHEDAGYFYYVMELADTASVGQASSLSGAKGDSTAETGATPVLHYSPHTLRADLAHGRLPAERVLELGLALTEALAHLHGHGLVHRDVKPSNIIFVGGRPKLADIGLVTDASDTCSIVGTEGYLAPEGPGTPPADLFALGKVLYEAATGLDRRQFPQLPPDLRTWPDAKLVFELNEILLKACAQNARDRYDSADAMQEELKSLQAGQSVKRRQAWQRSLSFGKRFALPISSCVILLTGVCLLVWRSGAPAIKLSKDSEANEEYHAGLTAMHTSSQESPAQAARYFEHAIELDPQFAAAYAQLSQAYVLMDSAGGQMFAKARDAATNAVFLDPQLSEAHSALATVKLLLELDWSAAEKERQLALELNPRSEETMVSSALILSQMGRWEEAVAMIEKALRIDSRSVRRLRHAGNVFLWSRQYDRAIQKFEQLIEVSSPSIRGRLQRVNLANAYRAKGDYQKSIQQEREGALLQGENPDNVNARCDALEIAFEKGGPKGYWQTRLELENARGGAKSFMALAAAHAELDEPDATFDALQRAFKETPSEFAFFIHITPSFDRLRSDKLWNELTNKLWRVK